MNNKIYILHENGSDSHYKALDYLCKLKEKKLIYREFSISKSIIKSILKFDLKLLNKQLINICFLIFLIFSKNKKVIIGIAPYDFRLIFLSVFLRKHKIYYHTSWSCWNGTFYPKKIFVNKKIINFWENFLKNNVIHIFAVSKNTKQELIKNLKINPSKITAVYHSLDENIFKPSNEFKIDLSFVYVGRLEEQKGLIEILEYFSNHPFMKLTIVGKGILQEIVEKYSKKYNNIEYIGYIKDEAKLAFLYQKHTFLVLNSKKTNYWEELFGMVIIEAMASGCIPLTTNHKGPLEIIENKKNGFIFEENQFLDGLDFIYNKFITDKNYFIEIKENSVKKGMEFSLKAISKKWEIICE